MTRRGPGMGHAPSLRSQRSAPIALARGRHEGGPTNATRRHAGCPLARGNPRRMCLVQDEVGSLRGARPAGHGRQ